jgi:hypothetical protein
LQGAQEKPGPKREQAPLKTAPTPTLAARKNQPAASTTSEPHLLHLTGLKYDTAQLLVLHGELQGEPVQILIDSGASANFVNASLVEKFAWTTHTKAQSDAVQLANGLVEGSRCVLPDAALSIGTYEDLDTFHVTRLSGHDVILGKVWLDRLNPVVDWTRNKLMFTYADQQHMLIAPELGHAARCERLPQSR